MVGTDIRCVWFEAEGGRLSDKAAYGLFDFLYGMMV